MEVLSYTEIIQRLILSALIASLIGFDRQKHSSAGIRTHILVAVGACVISMVQVQETYDVIRWSIENPDHAGAVSADVTRLPAQIVSGVGFLGAGTIIVNRDRTVSGLTTAASLWAVAGLGIGVGMGHYAISIFASIGIFLTLTVLNRVINKSKRFVLEIHFLDERPQMKRILTLLEEHNAKINDLGYKETIEPEFTRYEYRFDLSSKNKLDSPEFIQEFLDSLENVVYVDVI